MFDTLIDTCPYYCVPCPYYCLLVSWYFYQYPAVKALHQTSCFGAVSRQVMLTTAIALFELPGDVYV